MYDVVVVGGGPCGATAAHDLANSGHKVALLDREGRIKPCGGLNEVTTSDTLFWFLHWVVGEVGNPILTFCAITLISQTSSVVRVLGVVRYEEAYIPTLAQTTK